jgi:hypothetical protein
MAKKMQSTSDDPQREHYGEICDLSHEVAVAQQKWVVSKELTADYKKIYDKLTADLLYMITKGPDWQKTLEFGEDE